MEWTKDIERGTGGVASSFTDKKDYPGYDQWFSCVDIHTYERGGRFRREEVGDSMADLISYFNRNCPLHKAHIEM